jgi:hypothetical protein
LRVHPRPPLSVDKPCEFLSPRRRTCEREVRGTAKEQELLCDRVIEIGTAIRNPAVNTTARPLVVLETLAMD